MMDTVMSLNPLRHLWCLWKCKQMDNIESAIHAEVKHQQCFHRSGRIEIMITMEESRLLVTKVSLENELKRLGLMEGEARPTPSVSTAYADCERYRVLCAYTERGLAYRSILRRLGLSGQK